MRIFVSAAEISSDIHAEKIVLAIQSLLKSQGEAVQIAGIGGPCLRRIQGFRCIERAENLRAMGIVEVISRLIPLRRIFHQTFQFIQEFKPDLIITFDYPDFHFRLLEKVSQDPELSTRALKICGIPPKVWVWRSKRVEKIRTLYDGVWVIFPFEKKFYESHGIPVIFEGNPLISEMISRPAAVSLSTSERDQVILTVMPGSREAELKYHLPIIPETLELLAKKLNRAVLAKVPIPTSLDDGFVRTFLQNSERVSYQFLPGGSYECLSSTEMGLIKSGTSTLEAAVLGCTPVIFYRVNRLTEWIARRLIRYTGPIGLPNILLDIKEQSKSLFPEFLGADANPENLSNALVRIFSDSQQRQIMKEAGINLRTALVPSQNLNQNIASSILQWMNRRPLRRNTIRSSIWIGMGSFLWSSVNKIRRRIYRPIPTQVPSVLIGNLEAGGTGKTPLVIELAKEGIKRGLKVAVLSRAYRSQIKGVRVILPEEMLPAAQEIGDEPAEIRHTLPEVILGLGKNRHEVLHQLPKVDLVIFDDGFQNLHFSPSRTVLLITRRNRDQVLHRDFQSELKYADFVLKKEDLLWKSVTDSSQAVWLLCGVGDPESVVSFYTREGLQVKRFIPMPDHAEYRLEEVKSLMRKANEDQAVLAMTEKDFVKIEALGVKESEILLLRRELVSREWIQNIFNSLEC